MRDEAQDALKSSLTGQDAGIMAGPEVQVQR
jgi:hypothetical protein